MASQNKHTHSYLALRKAVGWIGILLPFVLVFGTLLLFKEDNLQNSISHYYHSGMRDVFIGGLCAVALFLFFYSGYDKWDNWTGNIAGLFALGVAWFPTTATDPIDLTGKIHLGFAVCFFLTLAAFSFFLFTKKGENPTRRKLIRNTIYKVCALIMIGCLLAITVYYMFIHEANAESHFVFWAETIALIAFGISWLTKGEALYPDK